MIIARRLVSLVLLMLLAALLARGLFEFIPGDKARLVLGERASDGELQAWNHAHGYDRPLPLRLVAYVSGLAHGDLGLSDTEGANRPVWQVLKSRLPATRAVNRTAQWHSWRLPHGLAGSAI